MFLKFGLKGQKKISTDTAVNVKYTNKTKSRRIYLSIYAISRSKYP